MFRRPSARLILAAVVALIFAGRGSMRPFLQAATSPIVAENAQTGNPSSEWDVSGAGDPSIQGFATDISVNKGQVVEFKVKTDSNSYLIDIYRLGYYGGAGARLVAANVVPSAALPQNQPACVIDGTTGLADCGNWGVSASWSTFGAVSGIYIAKLKRIDTGGASHIVFIVRDDARPADVVVQTSDTTWQAYNQYPGLSAGGASLYCGGPQSNAGTAYSCTGRATKVSYNRPMDTRDHDATSFLFNAEYPMVRWLEANGYDVKYISGVDTERHAADLIAPLRKPKVFISSGHDEYWSAEQRASVEAARNAGVSLAFFSGNEMYWKTRWETKVDGTPDYRTLVSYKDTLGAATRAAGVKLDPKEGVSTGTWRDTRFSPPVADGGRPENGLIGQIWTVNSGTSAIGVPASMANLRFWRNTRVATPTPGSTSTTLGTDTLGYEWDEDLDNGARPNGLIHLSATTVSGVEKILDFGETVGIGTATHHLTLYRHTNPITNTSALVFGAGTVQWAWGLDDNHDRRPAAGAPPDAAMQQATVNLLADMGAQPGTLQIGADPAKPLIASTEISNPSDTVAPTSVVTSPAAGGTVGSGDRVTISGTATDNGGGSVASVEVSVDGGTRWHTAQGGASWTYNWTPGGLGVATIKTRAIDDNGNIETAGSGVAVTVNAGTCPCPSLFKSTETPIVASVDELSAVELGVKFKSDIAGTITGVRFYRGAGNTGTHIGNLWTASGAQLASAEFVETETASGWQQVNFGTPVQIAANTTYVASYHTNVGFYAADSAYFTTGGVDAPPLHAPASAAIGGNGVFRYGASAFPTTTFNATNYWVDVVFAPNVVDTRPPVVSAAQAAPFDGTIAVITWNTDEPVASVIDYSTNAAFPVAQTLSVSDPAFVTAHTARLTGLSMSTQYFYRVRATDRSGNAVTAYPGAPSFTTPGPTLRDTTTANFSAGASTGTYVAEAGDGEVVLAPATSTEFSGSSMPTGWATKFWSPNGSAVVNGGRLVVDGARVAACVVDVNGVCQEQPTTVPGHSLEFVATFTGNPFQHSGFAQTLEFNGEPFALFSTDAGSTLSVRTSNGATSLKTDLGLSFLNAPHRFRIDWDVQAVDYYVDGVLKATHAVAIGGPMRPLAASDFTVFSGNIVVDWVRTSPYASTGTFVSRVFDAGAQVNWQRVQWTSTTPAGSTLVFSVCTGDQVAGGALANPTCTPLSTSGATFSATSRYVQYQATLATSDPIRVTPELSDVIVGVALPGPGPATSGPLVAKPDFYSMDQAPGLSLQVLAPGVLSNDLQARSSTVAAVESGPAHGALTLNTDGSFVYTPVAGFGGTDTFTYGATQGAASSTATVTITVGANQAPVASNAPLTTNEDAPVAGTLNATDADANALVYSIVANATMGTVTITDSATGAFTYTPPANANGSDSFTFMVNDGSVDSNVATVSVTVTAVNDAPSFTRGADESVLANAGPKTVTGWATARRAGPADEVGQSLSFIVTNNNATLFSAQPAVAPDGTLTYTSNAVGTATVSVAVKDSGLTTNGGVDTSAAQTFTITVVKATPTITWRVPATIIGGTALSATQLSATASVAGSFVYTPGIGTVLSAGPAQPLSVTFTPTDTVNYTTATASVPITVLAIISVSNVSITEGNVTGATKQAWVTVKLAQKSTAWVSVNYTTAPGSAKADVDYFKVSDTVWFAPGVVTGSAAIPIVSDTVGESTESLFVDFSGVVNGVLGQARSTITIVNDDSSNQVFSSIADFSAGTLGGGAYLSETADGELMLAPQGSEFSGTSLPAGWTSTPLASNATSTVANGTLVINGGALLAPAGTGSGQTLEFAATFSALADQSIGFGTSSGLASPMAMFVIKSDGELYARSVNGTRIEEDLMAGIDWLGKPHRYQITWTAGSVQYYVDGTLMISHTSMAWGTVTMRPVIIDSTGGDGALAVDWIRMTPYAGSGSYTSAVFDATGTVLWQKLTTTSTIPSGTTSTITYRTGTTPVPDETWTPFTALGTGGALAGSTRYMQFTIQIATTSGAKSPVIQNITVQFKR